MRHMRMVVVLAAAAILFGGCGTVVKTGLEAATGAKGAYQERQAPTRPLGMYQSIQVGTIRDAFGMTPSELLADLPGKIVEHLQKKGLPTSGSGKTLTIQGKILYYEDTSVFGSVAGSIEEVVAEIQLVDKDTGKVIGTAYCIGRTKTAAGKGVSKKTDGLAKGIVKWVAKHSPEAD